MKKNVSGTVKVWSYDAQQMAGEPAEKTQLGDLEEKEQMSMDTTDAKPDRKGRFLLFG